MAQKIKELMNQFAWEDQTNWTEVLDDVVTRESVRFKSWLRKHSKLLATIDEQSASALLVYIGDKHELWPKEKQTPASGFYIKKDKAITALNLLYTFMRDENHDKHLEGRIRTTRDW